MVIAETKRLFLRQFSISDGEAMDGVFGDAEVMHYGPGAQTKSSVREWLRARLEEYPRKEFGSWAVVELKSGMVIGYCGLTHFPDVGGRSEVEIGYRLARKYWGVGYATESAGAVRDYAFNILKLPRLIALIDPRNVASIRVAEKIGLKYEKDAMLAGYTYPDRVYAIARPRDE